MTNEQLDSLEALVKKATPHNYGNDGKLRAFGCYLTTRSDISLNVEHLGEMGQKRYGLPLQAIPFVNDKDAEAIAAAWNALPELIAAAREALELREALEFAADFNTTLVQESDGYYSCWRTDAWGEVHQYAGATPLEAINKARRGK